MAMIKAEQAFFEVQAQQMAPLNSPAVFPGMALKR
jgi:hypothetical protein